MKLTSSRIKVLFLSASLNNPSVYEQAVRICNGIKKLQEDIQPELLLIEDNECPKFTTQWWVNSCRKFDLIVVVKHTLVPSFIKYANIFYNICKQAGTIVVSNPVDGQFNFMEDPFTNRIADYVFTISRYQQEAISNIREKKTVYYVGHAVRTNFEAQIKYRKEVMKVIWENPVHYYPKFPAWLKIPYIELENLIKKICEKHDIEFIPWLTYDVSYSDWLKFLLQADIAIECKALNKTHSEEQLRKPPTKVQNYLSVGLPVICDSTPAYLHIGKVGKDLLIADTLEEWERNLKLLICNDSLRYSLGRNGREVVKQRTLENICKKYIEIFHEISNAP